MRLRPAASRRRRSSKELESRSLDGMVTFLTRFFPYLADCEAVRVLRYADADLLVAFRIVASDLAVTRLAYSEPAFKEAFVMALKCAALVAKHPNPDRLVADWLAISSRLAETVSLLAEVHRRSPASSLGDLAKLLDGTPQPPHDCCEGLWHAWALMVPRLPPPRSVPCLYSPALKGTLQDAIHGLYLKALACACPAADRQAPLPLPPQPARGRPLLRPARSCLQHHRQHHLVRRRVPTDP